MSDDPKWCRVCHGEATYGAAAMSASVHSDFVCRDCHTGYHFNPHEPVEEPDEEAFVGLKPYAERDPSALAACLECHEGVADETGAFAHGHLDPESDLRTPHCRDCHGNPHVIADSTKVSAGDARRAMNANCVGCHGEEEVADAVGTHPVHSYEDSVHARKLELGSDGAPGCVDCHGGHTQRDIKADRVGACIACHPAANATFASFTTHLPLEADTRPIGLYTQRFFGWLTFLAIFGLVVHICLDIFSNIRLALRRKQQRS